MASRTEGVYPEIDTRCLCLLSVTRRVLHTCSGGWILRTATVWIIDFGVGIHGALMNRWLKETCVVKLVSPAQMFKATCYSEQSVHTGCPRRNGQNFGRVFLMLKYTDITQHTYIQSWTVTEIKTREKRGLFAVPRTVPGSRDVIPIRSALSVLFYSWLKRVPRCDCTCKVLGNPKDNYDVSASVFVVQFNGFMSLTS